MRRRELYTGVGANEHAARGRRLPMKQKMLISVVFLSALAAQDRFTLKASIEIAFSEFK